MKIARMTYSGIPSATGGMTKYYNLRETRAGGCMVGVDSRCPATAVKQPLNTQPPAQLIPQIRIKNPEPADIAEIQQTFFFYPEKYSERIKSRRGSRAVTEKSFYV